MDAAHKWKVSELRKDSRAAQTEAALLKMQLHSKSEEVEVVTKRCNDAETDAKLAKTNCATAKERASDQTEKTKKYYEYYLAANAEVGKAKQSTLDEAEKARRYYDHYLTAYKEAGEARDRATAMEKERDTTKIELAAARAQQLQPRVVVQHAGSRKQAFQEVLALVAKWQECRHCYEDMDVWIEWDDRYGSDEDRLMLRCTECRTRHYSN